MDGKQRERAAKLDRRAVARLHAEIIDCADDPHKMSHHMMIDDLREYGVEVTFKQIENALRTLGYKWKEVFLPASNSDRGKKPRQPEADNLEATQEPASSPDMQAVLDRIEQLEQTVTRRGLAEYSGLHQQAQAEAGLAKERAEAIQADMKKMLEWTQTLASVAGKVSRMENWLFKVLLHVVPQTDSSEKEEAQQ